MQGGFGTRQHPNVKKQTRVSPFADSGNVATLTNRNDQSGVMTSAQDVPGVEAEYGLIATFKTGSCGSTQRCFRVFHGLGHARDGGKHSDRGWFTHCFTSCCRDGGERVVRKTVKDLQYRSTPFRGRQPIDAGARSTGLEA